MITIAPFAALRPEAQHAKAVASKPYDVLNRKEAKVEAQGNPASFLHITKSEIDLPETVDIHDQLVYNTAKENLAAFVSRGTLFTESKPCFYIYKLQMNGREQTGLVCTSSVDDYENGLIKKHEFTRPDKELDRINHIKTTGAQTGNVFLAYRNVVAIDELVNKWMTDKSPQYDFIAEDGISHSIWIVNDDSKILEISKLFKEQVPATYIADGHHRAASAAKVRAAMGTDATPQADGFLTTLFPSNDLHIMDYNRIVKGMNGHSAEEFIAGLKKDFAVTEVNEMLKPTKPNEIGLYFKNQWFSLVAKDSAPATDAVGSLDISIFQEKILTPLLGITDQRTDKRIDFIGGIRGIQALQQAVDGGEWDMAFSFYPVTIEQLFAVADSGKVMPPKTTWFEPKLRDGLLTHLLQEPQS